MDLEGAMEKNPHLGEYIRSVTQTGGIVPTFQSRLTEEMAVLRRVNMVYPVGDPVFIHVHDRPGEGRRYDVIEGSYYFRDEEALILHFLLVFIHW